MSLVINRVSERAVSRRRPAACTPSLDGSVKRGIVRHATGVHQLETYHEDSEGQKEAN